MCTSLLFCHCILTPLLLVLLKLIDSPPHLHNKVEIYTGKKQKNTYIKHEKKRDKTNNQSEEM